MNSLADSLLRRNAEALAAANAAKSLETREALSPAETLLALHELRVHQIELEMQNEELRRAQLELEGTRTRYFDLYDMAPVGYCTVSPQGLLLQANLTAASLFGLPRRALIDQLLSGFIVKEDQDVYYLHHKRLMQTDEAQSCELRMARKDGTRFWVQLVASNVMDADGVAVHRLMLIDITERKHLATALQEKNAELEAARHVADKANRAKSDFLSSMSHELRSPLNAILGFAQLIDGGTPPPTTMQKARIDEILRAGWYLLALIDEILDLAVIESGKLSMAKETIELSSFLFDCQAMIGPQAQNSGISMTFSPLAAPCFVSADPTHLKQVLTNLLSNAIKYNRAGGCVEVTCSRRSSARVRISVSDTGAGLSTDQLTQLFQPFNRLGQENGDVQGTGIGLVVSKRLVELMGGEIGVHSTVGVGTVFWIELDIASARPLIDDANQANNAPIPVIVPLTVYPAKAPRTVLYVEDNLPNAQLMEQLFARRADLRLLSADSALNGIALARAELPVVILMDINLRGMSGLEALNVLREDAATRHIPVVAVTADAMPDDIESGLAAGFFSYLTKPIKFNEFFQVLDKALEFAHDFPQGSSVRAQATNVADAADVTNATKKAQ